MALRRFFALTWTSLFVAVSFVAWTPQHVVAYPKCSEDKFKNRCGPLEVDELGCLEHGCCWSKATKNGEPRCFHRNGGYKYFSITARRIDCGWSGFTVVECLAHGCFHHDARNDAPSCFFPNTNINPAKCALEHDRVRCGDGFTRQEKCESMGCCWSPAGENSDEPWCFYSPRDLPRKAFAPTTRFPDPPTT